MRHTAPPGLGDEDPESPDFQKSMQPAPDLEEQQREVAEILGDTPSAPGPRASFDLHRLPVVHLNPDRCLPSSDRVRPFTAPSDYAPAMNRWVVDARFRASIRFWGGNYRAAYVIPDGPGPEPVCRIVSGNRRWAACLLEELPFAAYVLPLDMPADELQRLALDENTTGRPRDLVTRIDEAMEAMPILQAELAERGRLGRGGRLPDGVDNTTVYAEMAKRYFGDLGHEADFVRKLYAIALTASGRGRFYEGVPRPALLDDEGAELPSWPPEKMRAHARLLLDQLRDSGTPLKKNVTVTGAYDELETLYHDFRGELAHETRTIRSLARAHERMANIADGFVASLRVLARDVRPVALMTPRDRADMVASLNNREWAHLAKGWPHAIRMFLDVSYLMTNAHVHSRTTETAIERARASMDDHQLLNLAAALHQLGDLLRPSDEPRWWEDVLVVWPPIVRDANSSPEDLFFDVSHHLGLTRDAAGDQNEPSEGGDHS